MLNQLIDRYEFTLNHHFLIELLCVSGAILLSSSLRKFFDKKFLVATAQLSISQSNYIKIRLIKNYKYLSFPLYLTCFLTILFITITALGVSNNIVLLVTQFSILWFCLRVLTVLSGSKSPKPIIIIIAIVLFLDIFDLTDATVSALKGISIDFGRFKLTAFLIVQAILTLIISLWVISLISKTSERIVSNFVSLNTSARNITTVLIDVVLYFALFLMILNIIGVDITTVAVIGSAIGIGIGFGLQKITSNFISGLILLFEKSIKEGDVVELSNLQEEMGFVKHFGIRYTLIRTFNNKEIMVPNEDFITNKVTNWTFSDKEIRIRIDVGVSYNSDLELVKKLILEAANEYHDKNVRHNPICFLDGFGDSSVDFILYVWVSDVNTVQHAKRSDILFSIWNKFKDHNIEIPFPQRDLHIKTSPIKIGKDGSDNSEGEKS